MFVIKTILQMRRDCQFEEAQRLFTVTVFATWSSIVKTRSTGPRPASDRGSEQFKAACAAWAGALETFQDLQAKGWLRDDERNRMPRESAASKPVLSDWPS